MLYTKENIETIYADVNRRLALAVAEGRLILKRLRPICRGDGHSF